MFQQPHLSQASAHSTISPTYQAWDVAIRSFLRNAGLLQALTGFEVDMLVMNEEFEKLKIPSALNGLMQDLSVRTRFFFLFLLHPTQSSFLSNHTLLCCLLNLRPFNSFPLRNGSVIMPILLEKWNLVPNRRYYYPSRSWSLTFTLQILDQQKYIYIYCKESSSK
jgi:hypothetical protein